jgi:TetR/AcrR family transcriptional regulator, regulator of cefoperazone and chloramphenicol sensitivity
VNRLPLPPDDPPDDDARQRLLSAAGPIFAQRGFERATVREICRQAGVNIASVGYYYGDKLGLYLEVIRQIRSRREQRFPLPAEDTASAEQRLLRLVQTLLSRMMACGEEEGWEAQLMMREMHQPTEAFREMVQEYFRPMFEQLQRALGELLPPRTAPAVREQFAFGIVGQCLHYRIGGEVIRLLIPAERRQADYGQETLARRITAMTIAAARGGAFQEVEQQLEAWGEAGLPEPSASQSQRSEAKPMGRRP